MQESCCGFSVDGKWSSVPRAVTLDQVPCGRDAFWKTPHRPRAPGFETCSRPVERSTSELSLEALLQRSSDAAAELTGARYAALGVIDAGGPQLERFLTHGIDPATHAAIGELPRGRGILGVLIRDAAPLRLHDLAEDPRSVGFPAGPPADARRSSACRSCCAASPTGTCT